MKKLYRYTFIANLIVLVCFIGWIGYTIMFWGGNLILHIVNDTNLDTTVELRILLDKEQIFNARLPNDEKWPDNIRREGLISLPGIQEFDVFVNGNHISEKDVVFLGISHVEIRLSDCSDTSYSVEFSTKPSPWYYD